MHTYWAGVSPKYRASTYARSLARKKSRQQGDQRQQSIAQQPSSRAGVDNRRNESEQKRVVEAEIVTRSFGEGDRKRECREATGMIVDAETSEPRNCPPGRDRKSEQV